MTDMQLLILLVALVLDWFLGEPEILWSRVSHPVVLFGKGVSLADRWLNRDEDATVAQYRKGACAISLLIAAAVAVGLMLDALTGTSKRTSPASFADVTKSRTIPPIRIRRFRAAMEMEDPITLRITVVSVVILLRTSPVISLS